MLLGLSGCAQIKVKNTELCAVAGRLKAGADCVNTLNDDERSMNLDEFITFLEPQREVKDAKTGKVIKAERGAALCQSSDDFNATKTSLEQACNLLKNACTFEMKAAIQKLSVNTNNLLSKSKGKADTAIKR